MVHRNPETGQFVSDDGQTIEMTYSDHEHAFYYHEFESNEASAVTDFQEFDPVRDLDNDELAELVWLSVNVSADSDSATTLIAEAELGINQGEQSTRFMGEDDGFDTGTPTEGTGSNLTGLREVPQVLFFMVGPREVQPSGQTSEIAREQIPLRAIYGSGPFLDLSDFISSRILINSGDAGGSVVTLEAKGSWVVYEDEERRGLFAPL